MNLKKDIGPVNSQKNKLNRPYQDFLIDKNAVTWIF